MGKETEITATVKVKGKDDFLADIAEETKAVETLNGYLERACENAERLEGLLKSIRTA